jgi:hypothetical protein
MILKSNDEKKKKNCHCSWRKHKRESESCHRKNLSSRERAEAAAEADNSHLRADKMEENRIALTWNQRGSWRPEGVDPLTRGAAVLRRVEGVLQIVVLFAVTTKRREERVRQT